MKRTFVAPLFASLIAAVACGQTAPSTTMPTTRHAAIAEKGEPLVAIWNGGSYMLGTEARVLVAAWADGTVVREVGHRMLPGVPKHDARGRTVGQRMPIEQQFHIGQVAPAEVGAIVEAADRAGVRDLRPTGGVAPDGPFEIFAIARDGAVVRRVHDATFDRAGRAATDANGASYAALWRTAVASLRALKPDDERPLDGPLGLSAPKASP